MSTSPCGQKRPAYLLDLRRLPMAAPPTGDASRGSWARHRFSSSASSATHSAWAARTASRNAVAARLGERRRSFMNAQLLLIQLASHESE